MVTKITYFSYSYDWTFWLLDNSLPKKIKFTIIVRTSKPNTDLTESLAMDHDGLFVIIYDKCKLFEFLF